MPNKDAYADFMAQAYTMELDATERYAQFAEQLDTHNNREVAEMFRKLSKIEALHAKRILEEMGWPSMPALPVAFAWEGGEGPPLLFLHGAGGFRGDHPFLGLLGRHRRITAPSHPGFGVSLLPDWIDRAEVR